MKTRLTRAVLALVGIMVGGSAFAQPAAFSVPKCTDMLAPVQMHGSAVVGKRLYVFGGDDNKGWTNSAASAEITASGRLGEWRPEAPLPERRAYISQAVEVVNNRIYIVGGSIAADPTSTVTNSAKDVLWTEVKPDGTLGEWKHSDPFPTTGRVSTATCSTDRNLFVTGGSQKSKLIREVLAADFDKSGKPVNWRTVATLPTPLWFHGAAILENRMFIWGGLNTAKKEGITSKVWSAEVAADAKIGEWREEVPLPVALDAAAFCGFNDYLVCISGRRLGADVSTDIIYALVKDGRVQSWSTIPTNVEAQVYLTLGLDKTHGWILINGGQRRLSATARTPVATVQAFALEAPQATRDTVVASMAAVADWKSLSAALAEGESSKKDVMAYFYSPEVPSCARFEANVMAKPEFKSAMSKYIPAGIDLSKDTALGYKYSVFRVPSLVQIGPDGNARTSERLASMEDFQAFLSAK